jgi:Sec-independent protein translocase protein TatA
MYRQIFFEHLRFQFLIILVGYFVLGPSDLYKLVKQVGAFIQNIRTLGSDLSTTFENNMESTLQLEEIRKAQRELNDAFSFRRTINVDADSDAFSVQAGSAQKAEAERLAAAASATAATSATMSTDSNITSTQHRPKKIRRRMRKKEEPAIPDVPSMSEYNMQSSEFITNNIPDLDMPTTDVVTASEQRALSDEEAAIIEEEFDQYVSSPMKSTFDDWDSWDGTNRIENEFEFQSMNDTSVIRNTTSLTAATTVDPVTKLAEQSRFQQQLSGNWNNQILEAGDTLEPIALVMNKIALLEQEKIAALKRLDEEYAQRTAIEEKYYKEQRQLLEETARNVQSTAFGLDSKKTIA